MVPWVDLQCVIVVFLDHTHSLLIVLRVMDDSFAFSSSGYGWQKLIILQVMDVNLNWLCTDSLAYSSTGYLWQFGLSFYMLWMTVWLIVLLVIDDNFALILMANKFD